MNAKDLLLIFGFSAKNEDFTARNSGDLDFDTAYKNQKDLTLKFSNYLFTEVSSFIKGWFRFQSVLSFFLHLSDTFIYRLL